MGVTCLYCIVLLGLGFIYANSWLHGNQDPWLDIATMEKYNAVTPVEDKLPKDLSGKIIILYRYDCSSCHDVHAGLENKLRNENNVYYVCSRSEQGSKIVSDYSITEVPCGIYVPKNEEESLLVVPLSKPGVAGPESLNEYNLERLLKASRGESTYATPDPTPIPAEKIEPSPELLE